MNQPIKAFLSCSILASILISAQPAHAQAQINSLAPVPGTSSPMSNLPIWWKPSSMFTPPKVSTGRSAIPRPLSCSNAPTRDMLQNGWFMHWNFDTLDGCLIFTDSVGQGISYDILPCKIIGNAAGVRLTSGQGFFNGTGALECQIPAKDVPRIQKCSCAGFLMNADYVPNQPKNTINPIFWHYSAALEVIGSSKQPIQTINSYYRDTAKRTTTTAVKYASSSSLISGVRYALSHVGKNQWVDHFADATFLAKSTLVTNFKFDPTRQTMYIGYDPISGKYLNATVNEVNVDPGCYD